MDTQISITVGGLIAMVGFIIGLMSKFKKDIKEDTEQIVNSKLAQQQLSCVREFHDKIDDVKKDIGDKIEKLTVQVAKMNGE